MVFNAKNVLWISNILKKIKENHWKLEKKMLNRCRQRKTRWQKGLEVWEILEDLKPLEFGGKCQNISLDLLN